MSFDVVSDHVKIAAKPRKRQATNKAEFGDFAPDARRWIVFPIGPTANLPLVNAKPPAKLSTPFRAE